MVEIHKFIPLSQSRTLCLRSDKEEVERAYKKIEKATSGLVAKRKAWIEDRVRYAYELEIFLANIAETRLKELEELKSQRREDLKSRLEEAGWEESDWTFPWQIARKWATLVEGPKPLTDRVWQNLYPKMIPYLEKNREFQTERFKSDRRRQRERRMRALLVAMKKQGVLLKVNRAVIRGGTTPSTSNDLEPYYDSDDNLPSEAEDSDGHMVLFAGHREPLKVVISRPFPPMADALALPIVQELLEDDGDANALEDRFEESREEVEQVLWTWGETVEHELVDILKLSVAHDEDGDHKDTEDKEENQESDDPDRLKESKSNAPPVDLGFELPIEYSGFLDSLTPEARILLRADSVFRVADDEQAPLPLYYPELFAILQDRTSGWFGNDFDYCRQNRPKLGYEWDTSQVKGYSDGVKAAKVLLQELGRPDATHAAEAKLLSSSDSWLLPVLVKCNLCTDLGISFLAIREVMPKHIRAVHGIKAPKAGDRTKVYQNQEHVCIDTHRVKPRVSDSSDESEETDEATTADRARRHGLAVYWSEWGLKGLATYGD
ncbi:hypothetical protein FRC07_000560 [Ceratobasidium sp. 392]|nr:hypothetical protein FRC07_000560 [Ceratobasidium sp. 392]